MIKFPFTSLQQFNLDWIMQQLHKILDFMPLNGVAGDVLQRTADGAAWQPIAAISMDIHSLNAIGDPVAGNDELPIYDNSAQGIYKATVTEIMAEAPVQSVNGQTGVVVIGDAVDSVNGQTGVVVLDASDVGALPDTTVIPTDTGDLTNGAGFVDAAGAAAAAPVQSVNGLTGSVTITVPTNTNELTNGAGFVDAAGAAAAAPVQSVNGQTGNVIVSGGSSPTLLWTNASPIASFLNQTLAIDLSAYSFILIEYSADPYVGEIMTELFPVPTLPPPTGYASNNVISGVYLSGSDGFISRRVLTITTTGIAFGAGSVLDAYGSGNTLNNYLCKPLRIWGIE